MNGRQTVVFLLVGVLLFSALGWVFRLPKACRGVVSCARGGYGCINPYYKNALKLVRRNLRIANPIVVYEDPDAEHLPFYRSIRQVLRGDCLIDAVNAVSSIECWQHGVLLIDEGWTNKLGVCLHVLDQENRWLLCGRTLENGAVAEPSGECLSSPSVVRLFCFAAVCSSVLAVASFLSEVAVTVAVTCISMLCFASMVFGVPMVILKPLSGVCLLMSCIFLRKRLDILPTSCMFFVSVFLFVLGSVFALSHLTGAPNASSVVGGKAFAFLHAQGVPIGFWTERDEYRDMLPHYPPGMSMFVVMAASLFGVDKIWMLQAVGPFSLALLFLNLAFGWRFAIGRLLSLAVCLVPVSRIIVSGMYSECFVAMCLVAGIKLMSKRYFFYGAFVAGFAAWYKLEGFAFAVFIVLEVCILFRVRLLKSICLIMASALPALFWFLFLRCYEIGVSNFSFSNFSFSNFSCAFLDVVRVLYSDDVSLIVILFVVCGVAYERLRDDCFWMFFTLVLAYVFAFVTFFVFVYACFSGCDMMWHISTSVSRIFWVGVVSVVAALQIVLDRNENSENSLVSNFA